MPKVHGRVSTPRPPSLGLFAKQPGRFRPRGFQKAQITGRKRIGPPHAAHRDVLGRPGADSREFGERRRHVGRTCAAVQIDLAAHDGLGDPAQALGTRLRKAYLHDLRRPRRSEALCSRRQPVKAGKRCFDRLAKPLGQPPGEGRRRADRDLLAQDRSHGQLEGIHAAGHAQSRYAADGVDQQGVACQVAGNHIGPRIEVEQPSQPRQNGRQGGRKRRRQLDRKQIATRDRRDRQPAAMLANCQRPPVHAIGDTLDARRLTSGQEVDHRVPRIGRAKGERQPQAIG